MEPTTPALPDASLFEERYELLGELGAGSSGRVLEARQRSTGQPVAIKLVRPREGKDDPSGRALERFRREMRICAGLSHTNIVPLIDSGETRDGALYAVFAQVPGKTLAETLEEEGALEVREALRLMTQVLEALAAAHAQGIVHRDLKPANLMLSAAGVRRSALVLDFGLGGVAEGRRREEWQTLTQTREFLGTPLYAAPEQLLGEPVTPRSDLYAWGLIFLECLTGRHPFAEAGAAARLFSGGGAVEVPEWLRGHRLGTLLASVTAREAQKRDSSAQAILEALDAVAGEALPVAPALSREPLPLAERGERRNLTVMFCDLVGSSALSQQLDPETYRRTVRAYHARCSEVISRYAGHVAQYLGDGLLAYFGHPQAHEDDAERAVRAGLEILIALRALSTSLQDELGAPLRVRVGVHTGAVVVGEVGGEGKQETLALGETPNVAARLEAFAEPDTMMISDATRRLVTGLFVTEDEGRPELRGIAEPIRVYRVIRPSGVLSRLDRAPALTPFVGREQELSLLRDRFEWTQEGSGQAVWIAGEAGIGKSRLVHQLCERLSGAPHTWLECRCSPYSSGSALAPLVGLVEQGLRSEGSGEPDATLGRLEGALERAGLELEESVPLLAPLLSLSLPQRYAPLQISPQLQRQRTLETLLAWVLALGEEQPVVLLVEDLHWADPSTLEWLGLLIEQCATARVLLLLTFRPDCEPPWPAREHVLPIALQRLKRREAHALVSATIGGSDLAEALVERVAAQSDGIPLFAEELAKNVAESDRECGDSLSGLAIPETLQDSLMARLDRLGEAKQVAQVGASIGREFPYALLEAVAPLKHTDLREGLGRLVGAELLYPRGLAAKATYTFKHALVQDTAYQSLLASQRRELHGRIADALEKQFPERVARAPEEIAHHCEAAGRTQEAVVHYQRAGERATERSAHAEAIGHLNKALALLETLPQSPERDEQELRLQLALGPPVQYTSGPASRETEQIFSRALALSRQTDDARERFRALAGVALFYRNHDAERAIELGRELLELAERTGDPSQLLVAHSTLGNPLFFHGELTESLEHHERAIALYDPGAHRPLAAHYGTDPGISSLCLASAVLADLGYPDRGLEHAERALALAREGSEPFGLIYALVWSASTHYRRGEPEPALEQAEEAIAIGSERGLPYLLPVAARLRDWALSRAPTPVAHREIAELAHDPRAGTPPMVVLARCVRADTQRRLGRLAEALASLEEAAAAAMRTHAPFMDAESHRLKAEIRLAQDPAAHGEAEALLRRALEIASRQQQKTFELRAATRLARLWQAKGRRDDARALLSPVYDWFTEGFDTADLKEARRLLDDLS